MPISSETAGVIWQYLAGRPRAKPRSDDLVFLTHELRPMNRRMLANYYRLLGWDEQGVPTRETLEALGIGHVADDLGVTP